MRKTTRRMTFSPVLEGLDMRIAPSSIGVAPDSSDQQAETSAPESHTMIQYPPGSGGGTGTKF